MFPSITQKHCRLFQLTHTCTHACTHACTHTHALSHTHTHTHVHGSCCYWAVGDVSTALMSFWPMLSASLLNVWLPLLLLLLFVFSPCQHNPPIHPSRGPGPAGANPPLAASSGCSLVLLWSHHTVFGHLSYVTT